MSARLQTSCAGSAALRKACTAARGLHVSHTGLPSVHIGTDHAATAAKYGCWCFHKLQTPRTLQIWEQDTVRGTWVRQQRTR